MITGAAAHAGGRHDAAAAAFGELARRQPREACHWLNLGTSLRALGRYDEALRAYAQAHALGGETAAFCYNVGLTHLDRFDFESARAVLGRGVALAPRDALMRLQYAKACFESGETDAGVEALADSAALETLPATAAAEAGQRLQAAGEAALAARMMDRLAADPDLDPEAGLTLVQMLERVNRVEEAQALLTRLRAAPHPAALAAGIAAAQGRIAQRAGRHDEAIVQLREAVAAPDGAPPRHHELFPLAHSLAATGRTAECWQTLEAAHRAQLAQLRLSAPLLVAHGAPDLAIAQLGVSRDDVAAWDDGSADGPDEASDPVFIVAFPRSGTTLLEQALDAHPALASMDEQPFLHHALTELATVEGARYPDALAAVDRGTLAAIRGRYFERVRRRIPLAPGQRLLDKNPLNLLRLPAIRRLFPRARILLAVRHPCDVLLSCYMQHFTAPGFALLCADLPTLAAGYRRAFDAWHRDQAVLQAAVREVRYETLVGDFERELRGIAAFLDLPWHDAMLAPAAHARAKPFISTPSYAQVVQPVSARAVGRWRAYRRHFEPVLPVLAPLLERWGYDVGAAAG